MVARVLALAHNTFREAARDRVPLGLFGSGIAVGLASLLVAAMSLGRDQAEVVAVLTTAALSSFAIVGSIVLGASLLYKDLERKTIFPILARPVRRWELIVGKHLGLVATVATFACLMGALALALTAIQKDMGTLRALSPWLVVAVISSVILFRARDASTPFLAIAPLLLATQAVIVGPMGDLRHLVLVSVALSILEAMIIAAVALVFGSFSTPFLTAAMTVGIVLIGRNSDLLSKLPEKTFGRTLVAAGKVIGRVVPHLQIYVPPRVVLAGQAGGATLGYLGEAAAYGVLYALVLLVISALIFRQRDFA
jgi:Cu-processing system permease protein